MYNRTYHEVLTEAVRYVERAGIHIGGGRWLLPDEHTIHMEAEWDAEGNLVAARFRDRQPATHEDYAAAAERARAFDGDQP